MVNIHWQILRLPLLNVLHQLQAIMIFAFIIWGIWLAWFHSNFKIMEILTTLLLLLNFGKPQRFAISLCCLVKIISRFNYLILINSKTQLNSNINSLKQILKIATISHVEWSHVNLSLKFSGEIKFNTFLRLMWI